MKTLVTLIVGAGLGAGALAAWLMWYFRDVMK